MESLLTLNWRCRNFLCPDWTAAGRVKCDHDSQMQEQGSPRMLLAVQRDRMSSLHVKLSTQRDFVSIQCEYVRTDECCVVVPDTRIWLWTADESIDMHASRPR